MTLMHFDPFRDLERLTEQAFGYSRGPRALPMEALRRGYAFLIALDVPGPRAEALAAVARAARGSLRLEPGAEAAATLETLRGIPGIEPVTATAIVMRAMHWPDAFSPEDPELQRLWHAADARELEQAAEAWRPWRAHAAAYLRASADQQAGP